MTLIVSSINIGRPSAVAHGDKSVMTGIFKEPVIGPVSVRWLNMEGDGQADLDNHGGESKAVYAYALDHYAWWRQRLKRDDLTPGHFGENLTISGLNESLLNVGDQLRIGSALFNISQPRVPCFKLGLRFADRRLPKLFAASLRTGVYLRVLREGTVQTGDRVEVIPNANESLSIRTLFAAFLKPDSPQAQKVLERALNIPELSFEWRKHITRRLQQRGCPAG